MHKKRAQALRFRGQDSGSDAIHLHGDLGLGLGLVDRGVRGGIDDDVRLYFPYFLLNGVGIREVERRAISGDHLPQ